MKLLDIEGNTEHRGYDLHIFASDDDPQSAFKTSFTDENNKRFMSVLMGITEKTVRFEEAAKRETRPKGWPTGLFWFSDDQKACFAYEAIGQRAFAETPYPRFAQDWRAAGKPLSVTEAPRPQRVALHFTPRLVPRVAKNPTTKATDSAGTAGT